MYKQKLELVNHCYCDLCGGKIGDLRDKKLLTYYAGSENGRRWVLPFDICEKCIDTAEKMLIRVTQDEQVQDLILKMLQKAMQVESAKND